MNHEQLHEIAMLALSKAECWTQKNPVELAKEMFQAYNNVIDALKVLNNNLDAGDVSVLGMIQSDNSYHGRKR